MSSIASLANLRAPAPSVQSAAPSVQSAAPSAQSAAPSVQTGAIPEYANKLLNSVSVVAGSYMLLGAGLTALAYTFIFVPQAVKKAENAASTGA